MLGSIQSSVLPASQQVAPHLEVNTPLNHGQHGVPCLIPKNMGVCGAGEGGGECVSVRETQMGEGEGSSKKVLTLSGSFVIVFQIPR